MNAEEYAALTAIEIAAAVTAGELSATEVMAAALSQLTRLDSHLRAFTETWPAQAKRAAVEVDAQIARGEQPSLAGVPFAVKASEGVSSTQAVRLIAAGAIPIGATSVPGPGTVHQTWGHTSRGPTRNPWHPHRTPGGSSAGSAAAVAAGIVPMATASDGAGSTRIPAAWCGVIGIKPTTGLLAARDRAGLSIGGPLTRTAADARAYLAVTLDTPLDKISALHPRAIWSKDLGFADTDPEVVLIAQHTARHLIPARSWVHHELHLSNPAPAWFALRTPQTDPRPNVRKLNNDRLKAAFEVTDLILTPTTGHLAHDHHGPGTRMNVDLTWAFNLSGHPAISIPAGLTTDGTPAGLQIIAKPGHDLLLLELAEQAPTLRPNPARSLP